MEERRPTLAGRGGAMAVEGRYQLQSQALRNGHLASPNGHTIDHDVAMRRAAHLEKRFSDFVDGAFRRLAICTPYTSNFVEQRHGQTSPLIWRPLLSARELKCPVRIKR